MVHVVKYEVKGRMYFLRRGGLHTKLGTIFMHPCQYKRSVEGFEKRYPEMAGKGKVHSYNKGRLVQVSDAIF